MSLRTEMSLRTLSLLPPAQTEKNKFKNTSDKPARHRRYTCIHTTIYTYVCVCVCACVCVCVCVCGCWNACV